MASTENRTVEDDQLIDLNAGDDSLQGDSKKSEYTERTDIDKDLICDVSKSEDVEEIPETKQVLERASDKIVESDLEAHTIIQEDDSLSHLSDNQDDKIELRWEDDDDDEPELKCPNINIKVSDNNAKMDIDSEKSEPNSSLTSNESFSPNKEHRLTKPDNMLEIPTQELIDCSDEDISSLKMSPDLDNQALNTSDNNIIAVAELSKSDIIKGPILLKDSASPKTTQDEEFEDKIDDIEFETDCDESRENVESLIDSLEKEIDKSEEEEYTFKCSKNEKSVELLSKNILDAPKNRSSENQCLDDSQKNATIGELHSETKLENKQYLKNIPHDNLIKSTDNHDSGDIVKDVEAGENSAKYKIQLTEEIANSLAGEKSVSLLTQSGGLDSNKDIVDPIELTKNDNDVMNVSYSDECSKGKIAVDTESSKNKAKHIDNVECSAVDNDDCVLNDKTAVDIESSMNKIINADDVECFTTDNDNYVLNNKTAEDIESSENNIINTDNVDCSTTDNNYVLNDKPAKDIENSENKTINIDNVESSTIDNDDYILNDKNDIENDETMDIDEDIVNTIIKDDEASLTGMTSSTEKEKGSLITATTSESTENQVMSKNDTIDNVMNRLEKNANLNTNIECLNNESNIKYASLDQNMKESCVEESDMKSKEVSVKHQPSEHDILQPSTSAYVPEPKVLDDDDQTAQDSNLDEMSDSLGLLAESSRVMEDDEDPEQDEDDECDDDEDFDADDGDAEDGDADDDNSNLLTAEHSEDSNAQHSETDVQKETENITADMDLDQDKIGFIAEDESSDDCRIGFISNAETIDGGKIDFTAPDETLVDCVTEGDTINEDKIDFTTEDDTIDDDKIGLTTEDETLDDDKVGFIAEDETLDDDKADFTAEDETLDDGKIDFTREDENLDDGKIGYASEVSVNKQTDMEIDEPIQHAKDKVSDKLQSTDDIAEKDCTKNDIGNAMDIEIVKLSDTSDTEEEKRGKKDKGILKNLLLSKEVTKDEVSPEQSSPSKMRKLEITKSKTDIDIVDLEETSSEDDETSQRMKEDNQQRDEPKAETPPQMEVKDVTVNLPSDIDVISSSAGNTSDIHTKESEVIIKGLPRPPPLKPARINTSEVTIKTATTESTLVIPEQKAKSPTSLEIFSLDSDEEDMNFIKKDKEVNREQPKSSSCRCINKFCKSDASAKYMRADIATALFYDADKKKRGFVCEGCVDAIQKRNEKLIEGIRNFTPLLHLDTKQKCEDLVEIVDSDSEEEGEPPDGEAETIGATGAKFLEEHLADMINETWRKFKMDARLNETKIMLQDEMKVLEQKSKEIDELLTECQVATDKLRNELYASFERETKELTPIIIYDTPNCSFTSPSTTAEIIETRLAKRRESTSSEPPAKRPAIPLGYAPLGSPSSNTMNLTTPVNATPQPQQQEKIDDDNTEISVVQLSAEAAPADLPPPGELARRPLAVGDNVYAMKNVFGAWMKATVAEILPKPSNAQFSSCRVSFEHRKNMKNPFKTLQTRCLAYPEPAEVRMTIGTRVIALFKDSGMRGAYYSGVVAEIPNPVNNYRYLVFFDDGYAQYAPHSQTRLVCECSSLVWEEVHPFSREFVKQYLLAYPERPMVRLHAGQNLKTEWRGKWWPAKVERVDASLVQVRFTGMQRTEWIYRGSTRLAPLYLELQAAERQRPRALPRSQHAGRLNMPYVEYTRSDEQANKNVQQPTENATPISAEEIRRQRAVAKKSTVPNPQPPPQPTSGNLDNLTSRVVYYTPKNAVKPHKMTPHTCGPKCKRTDVLSLKELRTYNPLAKPLLSGWERQVVKWRGRKEVMYVGPCGRRLRSVQELHAYLRATHSEMPVDLFDFSPATHCLAEFVLNKSIVIKKDLSHGRENVPVPCVNYYDNSLPEFCSYNTERTPTAGVPLNLDPEFLCGCDCEDDCVDKTKCACWKMTLEGARTIGLEGDIGYEYRRLLEPLPSGIYECNSRCKCKHTCLNRVAQHPLQLKLQVFKTLNRGWGIRALNDVPKGAFLCVYAGNLLTDATANLDGLNEGDEYLAELDYIEVVEQMKDNYEDDIPEDIKKLDKKESGDGSEEEEESSDDEKKPKGEEDDDFQPGYIGLGLTDFDKRLRKRSKRGKKEKKDEEQDKDKEQEKDKETDKEGKGNTEDCIWISDDEDVREVSCFTAAPGMGASEYKSKYKSVRTLFGEDEACYIMDAKVQGNIGRYLNHSCTPNVFVQNVFVDTHDPRFPWVAFFALAHIRAGTELTWNYNYDVGSVPGKVLYCYCGAPNCRGRLL